MKFVAIFCLVCSLFDLNYADQDPVCGLPPRDRGPCRAIHIEYTYYPSTNTCKEFIYGGCGGNANRFNSQGECEAKCKK